MEQTTQQNIQNPLLPRKTKIAVWWISIIGGIFFALSVGAVIIILTADYHLLKSIFSIILIVLLCIFTCFIVTIFLIKKRKRWAWWLATIILFIGIIGESFFFPSIAEDVIYEPFSDWIYFSPPSSIIRIFTFLFYYIVIFLSYLLFIPLIPFILLLIDRKNFFKIAT